jgi:hypothetical protein
MAFGRGRTKVGSEAESDAAVPAPRFSPDGPIPRLDELPEVMQTVALAEHLNSERAKRERQAMILILRDDLRSKQRSVTPGALKPNKIVELETRLEALQAITPAPVPMGDALRGDASPEVAAALAIIARRPAPKMPAPSELNAEIFEIRKAEIVVAERLNGLRSMANFEMHLALRDRQRDLAVAVYHAAVILSEVVAAERQFDAELVALGYQPRTDIFVWPVLPAAYQLGHLADRNSQLSEAKRRFEARGIEVGP